MKSLSKWKRSEQWGEPDCHEGEREGSESCPVWESNSVRPRSNSIRGAKVNNGSEEEQLQAI
jgi:hypothetical protein